MEVVHHLLIDDLVYHLLTDDLVYHLFSPADCCFLLESWWFFCYSEGRRSLVSWGDLIGTLFVGIFLLSLKFSWRFFHATFYSVVFNDMAYQYIVWRCMRAKVSASRYDSRDIVSLNLLPSCSVSGASKRWYSANKYERYLYQTKTWIALRKVIEKWAK